MIKFCGSLFDNWLIIWLFDFIIFWLFNYPIPELYLNIIMMMSQNMDAKYVSILVQNRLGYKLDFKWCILTCHLFQLCWPGANWNSLKPIMKWTNMEMIKSKLYTECSSMIFCSLSLPAQLSQYSRTLLLSSRRWCGLFLSTTPVMRGPAHSTRISYKQYQVRNKDRKKE